MIKKSPINILAIIIVLIFFVGCTSRYESKESFFLTSTRGELENIRVEANLIPKSISKNKKMSFPLYWEEEIIQKGPYNLRLNLFVVTGEPPVLFLKNIKATTTSGKQHKVIDEKRLSITFSPPPDTISASSEYYYSKTFSKVLDIPFDKSSSLTVEIELCTGDTKCIEPKVLQLFFSPKKIETKSKIPLLTT